MEDGYYYLSQAVCNGPYDKNPGAGMSLRPAFYAGRGTTERDVTSGHMHKIFKAFQRYEARGCLPKGTAEEFIKLVFDTSILSGSAFVENLLKFEGDDFIWRGNTPSTFPIADGEFEQVAITAQVGLASLFGKRSTDEQDRQNSIHMKADLLHLIGRWQQGEEYLKSQRKQHEMPPVKDPYCGYYR